MPTLARLLLTAVTTLGLLLGGCVGTPAPPPSATPSGPPRPFTVLTQMPASTADPAGARNDSDVLISLDLFQRLMLVQPGDHQLKPDLAKECLFTAERTFECTLPKGITFVSGHPLTSSDVRFSLQRALRLAPQQMSLLGALRRIETPDPLTIRFRLKYRDSQFGYGLAAPAASIVDEEAYDADKLRPLDQKPIGSGQYQLSSWDQRGLSIERFPQYQGMARTDLERIRINWADSATAEQALADKQVEIVWRTLSPAAVDRLLGRIREAEEKGTQPTFFRWHQPRLVLQRLVWLPGSSHRSNAALRRAVSLGLQEDRTAGSILPSMIAGHTNSFALGGTPKVPTLSRNIALTLRFTDTSPAMADLAQRVRGQLESRIGIAVRIVGAGDRADLELRDSAPMVSTALGWLQDYLRNPLPGSAGKLADLEELVRASSRAEAQLPALTEIQKQAAVDATIVPIAEADGVLFLSTRADLVGEAFGSGGQLALWGARWRN